MANKLILSDTVFVKMVILWSNNTINVKQNSIFTSSLRQHPLSTYNIFQNQGTPFSSCLADATRQLASPGVASACLALRCLARQDEPRPMLSAGSDIWLLAQVVYGIVHNAKCIDIPFFSVRQAVFLFTKIYV